MYKINMSSFALLTFLSNASRPASEVAWPATSINSSACWKACSSSNICRVITLSGVKRVCRISSIFTQCRGFSAGVRRYEITGSYNHSKVIINESRIFGGAAFSFTSSMVTHKKGIFKWKTKLLLLLFM